MHVGKLIKEVLDQRKMVYAKVAEELNMSPQNFNSIFKRKSTDLELLVNLGKIVEYDFISHIARDQKSSDDVVSEPDPVYKKRSQTQKISIQVDLDGTEANLNYWFAKLSSINAIV